MMAMCHGPRRHLLPALLAWAFAVSATACAAGPAVAQTGVSVADIGGPVEPLAQLHGVRFGLTAAMIRGLRPNAAHSPYVGLAEEIGRDSIFYRFKGRVAVTEAYHPAAVAGVEGAVGHPPWRRNGVLRDPPAHADLHGDLVEQGRV